MTTPKPGAAAASRKKKPKYRYVTGVQCAECEDKIWSHYRHDYHSCKCGQTSVDGGRSYLKVDWADSIKEPKAVRISVTQKEFDEDAAYERRRRF